MHKRQVVHFCASLWHIVSSSVFLFVVASKRSDADVPSSFKFTVPISTEPGFVVSWETRCYDKVFESTFPVRDLGSRVNVDKRCIITVHPLPIPQSKLWSVTEIPVVAIPAFCAFWSAFVHLVCAVYAVTDGQTMRRVRFWADYSITAPLMLVATTTLWATRNVIGTILYPVLLCVLLVCAPPLEDVLVHQRQYSFNGTGFLSVFFTLFAFTTTTIAPTIDGAAASLPDEAPSQVWVAVFFFVVSFSFFLIPYIFSILERAKSVDVVHESDWVFTLYTACSMIAKTTLHANVALVAATQLLVGAQPIDRKPRTTMEDAGEAAIVATSLTAVAGILMALLYKCYIKK